MSWGKLYDRLFEDRQEADYVSLAVFEAEYVERQMAACDQLLHELRPLVTSLSQP